MKEALACSFASHSSQSTSSYDVMESDDDMALLVVKEQLNILGPRKKIKRNANWHGGLRKSIKRNPLAWWRTHEVHFCYVGFVAKQILGIVGFHIEVDKSLVL